MNTTEVKTTLLANSLWPEDKDCIGYISSNLGKILLNKGWRLETLAQHGNKLTILVALLRFWRLPNHPPKRIVHQTVSIYLFFVQSNFFECTRFLSSAPFEFNLASWGSCVSVFARLVSPNTYLSCGHVFALHFVSVHGVVVWFSDPTGNLFQVCLHWKVRMSQLAPIIMVPNHKPLITLATFFFPTPQIRFFTPSKNKNDGPKKHRKSRGPKTYRISNSQNATKIGLALSGTAKKTRPQNVSDPKRSFWAVFEGRKKQKKSTPKICGAAVNPKGKPRTTTESQWSTTEWKSTQPPTAIPTDSKVCNNWGSRCPSRP